MNRSRPFQIAALMTFSLLASCETANPAPETGTFSTIATAPRSSAIPETGAETPPPAAYVDFCRRAPAQCAAPAGADRVTLDAATWSKIDTINRGLNAAIKPMMDADHYGLPDYWTLVTDGFGDCEDSALTKRAALVRAGLPDRALRMAVVITPQNERHAVLTIATDRGDYVLDNLSDEIMPWTRPGYIWLTRQSPAHGMAWVLLDVIPLPMVELSPIKKLGGTT